MIQPNTEKSQDLLFNKKKEKLTFHVAALRLKYANIRVNQL